jgi:hypothetical protein
MASQSTETKGIKETQKQEEKKSGMTSIKKLIEDIKVLFLRFQMKTVGCIWGN